MRSPSRAGRDDSNGGHRSPSPTTRAESRLTHHRSGSPSIGSSPHHHHHSGSEHRKVLNSEALEKLNARMSKPKDFSASELGPLHKPSIITKAQLDASVDRMYKQAMDQKSRNISNARQRRDESEAPKMMKISSEELEDSVRRMYNQSVDRKQRNHEALSDKYLFKLPPLAHSMEQVRINTSKGGRRPSPSRPGSPDATLSATAFSIGSGTAEPTSPTREELVGRLYTKELADMSKRQEERYDKYIAATEPKMLRADADEIDAIVDRLYNGKK